MLGPDTEARELPALEVIKRSSPSRAEYSISTPEKKGKKHKFREEDRNAGVTRRKREPKGEDEAKNERKRLRRLKRLSKEAEKREVYRIQAEGDVETGLTKMSAGSLVQDGCDASYPRKRDRKKKKRRDTESVVCRGE